MLHRPLIDERVKHIGISSLRKFDVEKLRVLSELFVIHGSQFRPVAVLIPYEWFLELSKMQADAASLMKIISKNKPGDRKNASSEH